MLDPQQFRCVVDSCRRVLLTPFTHPLDLKLYLVQRLSDRQPETAQRVALMREEELTDLRREVLAAVQADADSHLWALP